MNLPKGVLDAIIGLCILTGAVECFLGYRIFRVVLGLTGFILGGALASTIAYSVSQQEMVALLTGLVGGFMGAPSMIALYFIGIFLIGALFGGVLGTVLFAVAQSNPEPVVLLISAVIAGIAALYFQRFMIILSTAFIGAWSVVTGIAYFTTGAFGPTNLDPMFRPGDSSVYAILLCWLALGILGVIVQYRLAPTKKEQSQPPSPLQG